MERENVKPGLPVVVSVKQLTLFFFFLSLPPSLCLSRSVFLSLSLSLSTYIYLSICLSIYLCICVCMYVCTYVSIYLYINVCVYISIHMYVYSSTRDSPFESLARTSESRYSSRTTLETTSGQTAPPNSGHLLECHLDQVGFPDS